MKSAKENMNTYQDEPLSEADWTDKCRPFNFKGYGNADASVWFVGLEFKGSGDQPVAGCQAGEQMYELSSKQIMSERRDGTHIYDYMAYIMARLRNPANVVMEDYLRNTLLQPSDRCLFTNAYMLPRPSFRSADLTPHMKEIGFTSIEQYKKTIERYRFDMLRQFWKDYKRAFAVCFGKDAWPAYRKLFNVEHIQPEPITIENTTAEVQFYRDAGVFLTPFFGLWGPPGGSLPFSVAQVVADLMRQNWPGDLTRP